MRQLIEESLIVAILRVLVPAMAMPFLSTLRPLFQIRYARYLARLGRCPISLMLSLSLTRNPRVPVQMVFAVSKSFGAVARFS